MDEEEEEVDNLWGIERTDKCLLSCGKVGLSMLELLFLDDVVVSCTCIFSIGSCSLTVSAVGVDA